jgi:hypothetical protein
MQPLESLQTAACTEKFSLIAVSKVMEKVPAGGGHHFSEKKAKRRLPSVEVVKSGLLDSEAKSIGLGMEPS